MSSKELFIGDQGKYADIDSQQTCLRITFNNNIHATYRTYPVPRFMDYTVTVDIKLTLR